MTFTIYLAIDLSKRISCSRSSFFRLQHSLSWRWTLHKKDFPRARWERQPNPNNKNNLPHVALHMVIVDTLEPQPSVVISLTLSWRRSLSYRNQSTDLPCKSIDWFLYDRDLCHEKVTVEEADTNFIWMTTLGHTLKY